MDEYNVDLQFRLDSRDVKDVDSKIPTFRNNRALSLSHLPNGRPSRLLDRRPNVGRKLASDIGWWRARRKTRLPLTVGLNQVS